jgi:hypothetical protein
MAGFVKVNQLKYFMRKSNLMKDRNKDQQVWAAFNEHITKQKSPTQDYTF